MAMKHFKTVEWVDFVNRACLQEQTDLMQKHLESGCEKCAKEVARWRKVRSFATAEPAYQPPEQAVRTADDIFGSAGWASDLGEKTGVLELLFDSLLQPAYSVARPAGTRVRRMLYRADSFQIDLQIEAKPDGRCIVVTGQVLDVGRPQIMGSGLEVTLSNRRGDRVPAITNEFGEFHLEIQNYSGDLELTLRSDLHKPIIILLKDPLADLREGNS
jgi:hypothetical protein